MNQIRQNWLYNAETTKTVVDYLIESEMIREGTDVDGFPTYFNTEIGESYAFQTINFILN